MATSWLKYANSGATRSQPISPELLAALSFLPEMGVSMEVFSGGQPGKGSGLPRVGSTRHDHGKSADVFFYKDGRRLSWENPSDVPLFQEIVSKAKARGVTGFGAGPGYMQAGSMHIGFGTPSVWGAGGKGANAPKWLREAYSAPAPAGTAVASSNLPAEVAVTPMPASVAAAGVSAGNQPALAFGQPETANTPPEAFDTLLAGGASEQKPIYEMPTRKKKVVDPALIEQLNAPSPITQGNTRKKVEDPELLKALNADKGGPAPATGEEPSIREDMGRSVLSGIRQGVEGLAGVFGDVNKAQGSIVGWLSTKLGASPETAAKVSEVARRTSFMPMAPTTEELRGGTTAVVGEPYQPQTVPGEYARTVGEFVPGMLIPGQGGLAARATNAIVPALTSETAGQLTKGTAAEPYARLAGGLAGGAAVVGGRALLDARAARNAMPAAPTADELRQTGNQLYETAKNAGVTVKKDAYGGLVRNVAREMKDYAFDKDLQPRTTIVLKRLLASKDAELSLPELENLRKMASTVAREAADASDKNAARIIVDQIDSFIDDAANFSANGDDALAALREARGVWKRKMKADVIADVFNKADLDTSKYTQSGLSQTITNNFKTLAKNDRKMAMFTKAEQEMIRQIVKGTKSERIIRWLAKLAPRGVISAGTGAALGNLAAGPAGMFIGPAVGQGAAMLADRNAARSVQALSSAVSSGVVPKNSYPLQLAPLRNSLIMGAANSNALSPVR